MKIPLNNSSSHDGANGYLSVTINGVCLLGFGSNELKIGHKCYDPMTARQLEGSIKGAYEEGFKQAAKLFQKEADALSERAKLISELDFNM